MTNTSGVPQRGSYRTCAVVGVCLLAGCVDTVRADADERVLTLPPSALFDPQDRVIPLPNDLLRDPATGRVNVPAACGEQPDSPAAQLRAALNQLDGFGTSQVSLTAPFNVALDAESAAERVFLLRLAERGEPLGEPERVEVDVATLESERLEADCETSSTLHTLVLRPRAPLVQSSTYGVVLLSGIVSAEGETIEPSASWALVRQSEPPVEFDEGSGRVIKNDTPFDPRTREGLLSLQGLDRLWRGHAPLLAAWDAVAPALTEPAVSRDELLLAWAFTTQTLGDPLDPDVPGSPAAQLSMVADELAVPEPIAGEGAPLSIADFFASALPGTPCSALACDAIGWIYADTAGSAAPTFVSPSYLADDDCETPSASPSGAFDDPLRPSFVCDRRVSLLTVVPSVAPGPDGYPVAIFAHGLGRSKEDLLAIAGSLASAGILSVAFDAADHGSRAVQISDDPELGCAGPSSEGPCMDTFGPTCAPQCFAPLLSANLAVTRDHLRQTLLDQRQLERVLAACGEGTCDRIVVDPARIGYVGHALGALLGAVAAATSEQLSGAVLNEAAGDWVGVLSDTATDAIRCPLVDSLIAGGVLEGTPWAGGAASDATCLSEDWKQDPGFREFAAAARWLLDPVDPLNYAARLASGEATPVLLGEIAGDPVIPNGATSALGSLLGFDDAEPASVATAPPLTPSPAALAEGNGWLRYTGIAADAASGFPGNAYGPGSLLAPAPPAADMAEAAGQLGTGQLRVDAITFLGSRP